MKKVIFLFAAMAVMASCKDKKEGEENTPNSTEQTDLTATGGDDELKPGGTCDDLIDILEHLTYSEQVSWLRDNDTLLCSDYLSCIEKFHAIEEPKDYDEMVEAHWGTSTPVYTEFTFAEILNNTQCGYDNYIRFAENPQTHTITFGLTPSFSTASGYSCYSVLLFKSILLNHSNLNQGSKLKFTMAGENGGDKFIVFLVDDLNMGFFDFSRKPPLHGYTKAL